MCDLSSCLCGEIRRESRVGFPCGIPEECTTPRAISQGGTASFLAFRSAFGALGAPAAVRLDVVVEKVLSVVVGELLSGLDGALRLDMDFLLVFVYFGVAVGAAGVVDVAGDVFAADAIDVEVFFDRKEVRAAAAVCFLLVDPLAGVLDDVFILFAGNGGVESETGTRLFYEHTEFLLTRFARSQRICFFHCVCVTRNGGKGKRWCYNKCTFISTHIYERTTYISF